MYRPHCLICCLLLSLFAGAGCAGRPYSPKSPAPIPNDAAMGPPPFAPIVAEGENNLDATHPGPVRLKIRKAIFHAAWSAVLEKDFDQTLGGLDWKAEREKFEPLALSAPDEPTFYRLLNQMLSGLGQSHLEVQGPGAHQDTDSIEPSHNQGKNEVVQVGLGTGDPGITVRWIESKPTITQLRSKSSAAIAGLKLGYGVTHIGGRTLINPAPTSRALRPVEEKFRARRLAASRLSGPVGSQVTVRYLDENDKPHEVVLTRDPPQRPAVQALLMPPLEPEVRTAHVNDVGIIAFNFFLLDPILVEVQKAIEAFRKSGMKTIILDLRGNPGGFGSMAIPIAAKFLAQPTSLGTIQFRDFANTLQVVPPLNHTPFLGKLIILTDEGTASTAEILAAGLQESKRALVVGENTVGAALGSTIEELPGGAIMQIPVAGYKTPGGISLEGRGVKPDRIVFETRGAWLAGQDMVLETALAIARGKK